MSNAITNVGLALISIFGATQAVISAGDLSRYREFRFGSTVLTVAKQAGINPAEARVAHRRPALIQDLEWRPQPKGAPATPESVQVEVFRFVDGALFQITVNYDRYQTEGLTVADMVEPISLSLAMPGTTPSTIRTAQGQYGDEEELLAQWQDSTYSFELLRSSYGPTYKLVGVVKRLRATVAAPISESARLDDKEAPQREADRIAKEEAAERVRSENARVANKPKFRP